MNNVIAVFKKQLKDTLKNKTILIQFVMFPAISLIMNNAIQVDNLPKNYFIQLFAAMYIGMAPLLSMAAIISEEKEINTLRVLMMSNVKPREYLLGVGSYVWLLCMLGAIVFCVDGGYQGMTAVAFLAIMAVGILAALLIGAAIGTWSKNQMMETSITIPVMMVFSFLPMLAQFNSSISKVAGITYSEQISRMMGQIEHLQIQPENVIVILINMLIAGGMFVLAYRKCGLA